MVYTYTVQRTQIYLSQRMTETLDRVGRETGRTRSQLIREAIEQVYERVPDPGVARRVLRETAGAWKRQPGELGHDSIEYVDRLRPGLGRKLDLESD